jgi:phenylacetate-coenzyme A ligase PaaK-like adenylate-forming protein
MTVDVSDPMAPSALAARARELLAHDRWSREELLSYQGEQLRSLLRHAVDRSPYYRETLGQDAPERPLESLPVLTKPTLMREFDRVVTDTRLRKKEIEGFLEQADAGARYLGEYHVFSTSGSTGIPGIFVFSHRELAFWAAQALASLARVGVTPETRLVAIGAPSALHITRQLFAPMMAGSPAPRLSVLTPLEEMVAELNRFRPEALLSYASVVGLLAEEQRQGRLRIAPRIVITTSEVLTEDAAHRIEQAWGSRPLNAYASTEDPGPTAVSSPEDPGLEIWESSAVLEVVDDQYRPVPAGEPGTRVLLTNLVNRAQPLIRYELSDSVVVAEGPNPAGRPWGRLARVDGRADDILLLPATGGGTVRVHPFLLRRPFLHIGDVLGYQIVHADGALTVRVVPAEGAGAEVLETVRAALSSALAEAGVDVDLHLQRVTAIEREPGPAAKVKLVRSEVAIAA